MEKSAVDLDGLKPETYVTEVPTPFTQGWLMNFISACVVTNSSLIFIVHVSMSHRSFWRAN